MSTPLQKVFGVDEKGRPTLPNSRRQLLIGGIVCLLIWPGTGLMLLLTDQLRPEMRIYAVLSPLLIVTALGIYVIGQAAIATRERPKFTKKTAERKQRT